MVFDQVTSLATTKRVMSRGDICAITRNFGSFAGETVTVEAATHLAASWLFLATWFTTPFDKGFAYSNAARVLQSILHARDAATLPCMPRVVGEASPRPYGDRRCVALDSLPTPLRPADYIHRFWPMLEELSAFHGVDEQLTLSLEGYILDILFRARSVTDCRGVVAESRGNPPRPGALRVTGGALSLSEGVVG